MLINFDTRDRQLKMIEVCFKGKWDVFFNKLFDYLTNPCYATESAFFYQLTYETSMQSDWTATYMVDSVSAEGKEIKKLSDMQSPRNGFSDVLVLRIKTKYATYYTKFWEEEKRKRKNV